MNAERKLNSYENNSCNYLFHDCVCLQSQECSTLKAEDDRVPSRAMRADEVRSLGQKVHQELLTNEWVTNGGVCMSSTYMLEEGRIRSVQVVKLKYVDDIIDYMLCL